ncbi:MAG TPA: four helix bundle protein [Opitutaceae bacterium]|nr:four helix bundle protein [Opitutaceae bacterium]
MAALRHFSDLDVYRDAFRLGIRVWKISRGFPPDERFALTDQVRSSARSIGANIAEAWAKRRYRAHFVSKLSDADAELRETEHWLACAFKHGYLSSEAYHDFRKDIGLIGRRLGAMMAQPGPFVLKTRESIGDI